MRSTIALASVQTLTETRRRGRSASSPPARSWTCQWGGGASRHAPTTRSLSPSRGGCSARHRLGEHNDLPIVHVLSSSLIGFDSSPCIRNRTHLDHCSALHGDLQAGTPQIDLHLLAPRAARHRNIHLDMVQRLRPTVRKSGLFFLLALRRSMVMRALLLRRQCRVLVRRQRHGSVRRTWQVEVLVCTALWCGGRLGLGRRRDAAGRGMGRRCAGGCCLGLRAGWRLDKDIGQLGAAAGGRALRRVLFHELFQERRIRGVGRERRSDWVRLTTYMAGPGPLRVGARCALRAASMPCAGGYRRACTDPHSAGNHSAAARPAASRAVGADCVPV